MKRIVNREKKAGRPAGSKTRYPGIEAFAREHDVSHQFVRHVLDGKATSAPVSRAWRKWQAGRAS
jgi:hypothetical protein